MKNIHFFNKGLPKWPGLLVVGDKIAPEQASEIIIRTDGFRFSSNEHDAVSILLDEVYGVKVSGWCDKYEKIKEKYGLNNIFEAYNWVENKNKEYNLLKLHYLQNSRIVSCYIEGAHGWCDWEGNIGTSNYNIGKYPDIETVYNEWKRIAKAFPFLNLKSQLLNKETCEENPEPVVTFVVKEGKVKMIEQKDLICEVKELSFFETSEIGAPIPKIIKALHSVKEKYKLV